MGKRAGTASRFSRARDAAPTEIRRGLPGDPDDTHSRYIEATIDGARSGGNALTNDLDLPM
jgi:exodeoxyribonuclease III